MPTGVFGGWLPVSSADFSSRVASFRLYVDGRTVASEDVTYEILPSRR
jgi:hypothetical protein